MVSFPQDSTSYMLESIFFSKLDFFPICIFIVYITSPILSSDRNYLLSYNYKKVMIAASTEKEKADGYPDSCFLFSVFDVLSSLK